MRVGVIGGSGFIGARITNQLLDEGHDVTIFDIMRPAHLDVRFVTIDVTEFSKTVVALAGGFDAIYLLAAVANVNDVYMIPVESTFVNIMSTANVLEAARRTEAGRFILASTTWIYNAVPPGDDPLTEQTSVRLEDVGHLYTATKISAELLTYSYRNLYELPVTILRYGIPYGPGGRVGTVITNFVTRALQGQPLRIQGTGEQQRSFIYVDDLARGNVAALSPIAANRTYNLEGPRPVSIREVADTVKEVIGNHVEIQVDESGRQGDFSGRPISSNRAFEDLGWKPQTQLKEGVERYVEWLRAQI